MANYLDTTGLTTQVALIKGYIDQEITAFGNSGTVANAISDEDGNAIKSTYVKVSQLGSQANNVPVFTSNGHLVLPSGIEIY